MYSTMELGGVNGVATYVLKLCTELADLIAIVGILYVELLKLLDKGR